MRRSNLLPLALLGLLLTPACKGDEDTGAAPSGADGGDGQDGQDGDEAEPTPATDLPTGTFLVTFSLAPVGGLQVPFQAEARSWLQPDGRRTLDLQIKATNGTGDALSEVLMDLSEVEVAADGSWSADPPAFILPGAFAPTGSDVEVDVAFDGSADGPDFFCGSLSGEIVTFGMDLAGSSFGAIPWDQRAEGGRASCDSGSGGFDPITDCPTLSHGLNTAFPSAEESRSFELVVPTQYDSGRGWPVVFAYHGLGGNIDDMLDSGLREFADSRGALLVVPQGLDFGGNPGWDAINTEATNRDLAFFDDMLYCLDEQYAVASDQVYVTGMSNGGLMTGALMARRSEVIAAAAPMSGGVITDWPAEATKVPTLVIWGGAEDEAYEQDFNLLATELQAELDARGTFHVSCDHGLGHELRAAFWPWTFDFLLSHPKGVDPEPYAGGLPGGFPEYCSVPE